MTVAPTTTAPAAPATLRIGTRSASARRAKGTLKVAVASDQPVSAVVAILRKGTKKVGTARLVSLSGKGALKR